MSTFTADIGAKSVELLMELVPKAAVIAYLVNPSNPAVEIYAEEATRAASALGVQIRVLNASTEGDLDNAFSALAGLGAAGLSCRASRSSTANATRWWLWQHDTLSRPSMAFANM